MKCLLFNLPRVTVYLIGVNILYRAYATAQWPAPDPRSISKYLSLKLSDSRIPTMSTPLKKYNQLVIIL